MSTQKSRLVLAWGLSICLWDCSNGAPKQIHAANPTAPSQTKSSDAVDAKTADAQKNDASHKTSAFDLQQQLEEARKSAADLKDRKKATRDQLALIAQVNNKFCQRLFQYRSECGPAVRLIPESADSVFGCVGNVDNAQIAVPKFTVKLLGSSATFKLIADGNIESSSFQAGHVSEITWVTDTPKDRMAPRISELTNLKLKQLSGTLAPVSDLEFQFKVGNAIVFEKSDLLTIPDALSSYRINTLVLNDQQRGAACRVPESELAHLIEVARQEFESQPALEETPAADESSQTTDAGKLEILQKNMDDSRSEMSKQAALLDRENDRNGKLRRELMGDAATGCFAKQAINKFEIILKGEHLPLPDWDRLLAKNAVAPSGSPKQMTFQFGDDLGYVHTDEEQQSIFRADGNLVLTSFSNRKIGDIERIVLKKGGVSYDSIKNCWNTFPLGQACEWQNRESARYKLNGIAIKVNDQLFYSRDAIGFELKRDFLEWSDKNLAANPDYVALMRRQDCQP